MPNPEANNQEDGDAESNTRANTKHKLRLTQLVSYLEQTNVRILQAAMFSHTEKSKFVCRIECKVQVDFQHNADMLNIASVYSL